MNKKNTYILGFIIIALGLTLLAKQMGWFYLSFGDILFYFIFAFIAYMGILLIIRFRTPLSIVFGTFITFWSLAVIVRHIFDYYLGVDFLNFNISRAFLPSLFIMFGILLIFSGSIIRDNKAIFSKKRSTHYDPYARINVYSAIFGDLIIDTAVMQPDESGALNIKANASFGSVVLYVDKSTAVVFESSNIFGRSKLFKARSGGIFDSSVMERRIENTPKTLYLKGNSFFGDINVMGSRT